VLRGHVLAVIPGVFVWIALFAWTITLVGMLRSLGRRPAAAR
jgi:hypothetical protein